MHSTLKGKEISNFIAAASDPRNNIGLGNEMKSGLRVLLVLSNQSLEPNKSVLMPDDTQIWQSVLPILVTGKYPNIYSEIFPYILKKTNQELIIKSPINYTSENIMSWLDKNNKGNLKKSHGIIIGIGYTQWSEDNNTVNANIALSSSNDYSYLVYKEFEIKYDTTMTGSHICLLYTSPSPRDGLLSRMPSSA